MLGSIIGDIIGSPYEFHNIKTKDFELFSQNSHFTDDTILTCATAEWLLTNNDPVKILQKWGNLYKERTYENGKVKAFGSGFTNWLKNPKPYNANTNGCIMRLSPISILLNDLKFALQKATELSNLTHNHPESINATKAYIETMYLVKQNLPVLEIKEIISKKYNYNLSQPINEIRKNYNKFYITCKNTVPQAIICALNATSYEDSIRNAVSLGGDSDTLACMTGGIAELKFGISQNIKEKSIPYLDQNIKNIVDKFYKIKER